MDAFESAIDRGEIDLKGFEKPLESAKDLAAFILDDENNGCGDWRWLMELWAKHMSVPMKWEVLGGKLHESFGVTYACSAEAYAVCVFCEAAALIRGGA